MEYKTKSVIISRLKREPGYPKDTLTRPCRIALFDCNDPHMKNKVPLKSLDFDKIKKIVIKGLDVNYFVLGNDLVVNDLKSVNVNVKGDIITVTGKK